MIVRLTSEGDLHAWRHVAPQPGGGTQQEYWTANNARYTDGAAPRGWSVDDFTWGHELTAPAGATTHEYYGFVSTAWASQWPVEDLWVAHLGGRQ
jgi:hypothetical protein